LIFCSLFFLTFLRTFVWFFVPCFSYLFLELFLFPFAAVRPRTHFYTFIFPVFYIRYSSYPFPTSNWR
jgi:hypothetical protein